MFRKSGLGVNTTEYEARLPTRLEPSYAFEDVLGELGSCIEWRNASQSGTTQRPPNWSNDFGVETRFLCRCRCCPEVLSAVVGLWICSRGLEVDMEEEVAVVELCERTCLRLESKSSRVW